MVPSLIRIQMDIRRAINKARSIYRLSDRTIEINKIGNRNLKPQVLESQQVAKDNEIWISLSEPESIATRFGRTLQQRLQLANEPKSIYGEVSLRVSGRHEGSEMAKFPNISFNGCYGLEFDVARSHPLYSEFKYFHNGNEAHRAKYPELLADCNDRNISLLFPGIFEYFPNEVILSLNPAESTNQKYLLGKCNIYVDLPSVRELKSHLEELNF